MRQPAFSAELMLFLGGLLPGHFRNMSALEMSNFYFILGRLATAVAVGKRACSVG